MTSEPTTPRPPGLRALVHARLPRDASPTDTLCQPLDGYVLERAQGDVVALTARSISDRMGGRAHVVLTLREADLDPATDEELLRLARRTNGGVLVFGVSYTLAGAADASPTPPARGARVTGESCPECGSEDAFELAGEGSQGAAAGPTGRVLVECAECGAVWD